MELLLDEEDYDIMCTKLRDKDIIAQATAFFPHYNVRVLLTSFMLKNFRIVFDISDELFELSKLISGAVVTLNYDVLNKEYTRFFTLFSEWRNTDIENLKSTIQVHKDIYTSLLDEEVKDEADEQWHEGVSNSIDIMNKHMDVLDEYSKTPPQN